MKNRLLGPNAKRLVAHKMALDAVPNGGGMLDALTFLLTPGCLASSARDAAAWVCAALDAVKSAPDNAFGDDDEAIAGELLRRLSAPKGGS